MAELGCSRSSCLPSRHRRRGRTRVERGRREERLQLHGHATPDRPGRQTSASQHGCAADAADQQPGAEVGAEDGADLGAEEGSVPKIALPSATRVAASSKALGVLDDPAAGAALVQLVQVGDHPLHRPLLGADFADRGDLGAEGEDRLDLQRRADQRLGGADAPALAQVLERVEAEPHLQALAGLARGLDHLRLRLPCGGGFGGGEDEAAEPAGAGLAVDDLDPAAVALVLDHPGRLAGALVGAGEAGGDVDRDDVAAGFGQRLVDGEEVADRGLRGRGQVGGLAQARVEVVEVVARARAGARRPSRRRG